LKYFNLNYPYFTKKRYFRNSELKKIHADLKYADLSVHGDCNAGWRFDITWQVQGDYEMVQMLDIDITGVNHEVSSDEIRSGGVYVQNIPGKV